MPKQITSVLWEASPPDGLTFDSATGTFTGTPSVSAGEYEIPVKVTTNYGSDEKDLKVVIMKAYPVYAIGGKAEEWSEGAEPDANGFRKLNIPNAYSICRTGNSGFSVRCKDGNIYACGEYPEYSETYNYGYFKTMSKTVPTVVSDGMAERVFVTLENSYSNQVAGSTWYYTQKLALFRDRSKNIIRVRTSTLHQLEKYDAAHGGGTGTNSTAYIKEFYDIPVSNFKYPLTTLNDGYLLLNSDTGNFFGNSTTSYTASNSPTKINSSFSSSYVEAGVKMYRSISGANYSKRALILDNNGKLHRIYFNSSTNNKQFDEISEKIIDFWTSNGGIIFVLTEDKELLVCSNSSQRLGLGENITTTNGEFLHVGYFDVKNIILDSTNNAFLLTNDGKLYHTGAGLTSTPVEQHNVFTQIFSEYNIKDIIYTSSTFIVTMEE